MALDVERSDVRAGRVPHENDRLAGMVGLQRLDDEADLVDT